MKNLQEQIERINNLFNYKVGVIISEQSKNVYYDFYDYDSIKISIPKSGSTDTAVFFAGMDGPQFLNGKIPDQLRRKKIVIVSNYGNNLDKVIKQVGEKGHKIGKITSVSGYSRGGPSAWEQIGKVPFVGLMDPVTGPDQVKYSKVSGNVKMIYELEFWKSWGTEVDVLNNIQNAAKNLGNNAIKVDKDHSSIPSWFFNEFGNML